MTALRKQRIAVICFGLDPSCLRRQPWHSALGIARGLAAGGARLHIFTDGAATSADLGLPVSRVPGLHRWLGPSPALIKALKAFAPQRTLIVAGPQSLLLPWRLRLPGKVAPILAMQRFDLRQIIRLGPRALWRERRLIAQPLLAALTPGRLLRHGFHASRADDVIYLSDAAQSRYRRIGLPEGRVVHPQVDPAHAVPLPPCRETRPVVGYVGPALHLRGADLAVTAFERALDGGFEATLRMFVRVSDAPKALGRLRRRVERSRWRQHIELTGADLSARELHLGLDTCKAVLLPFRITASDVPLVVIEAALCGQTVVTLDTPGVSEVARRLGGIVAERPGDLPDALVRACAQPRRIHDVEAWTDWTRAVQHLHAPATRCLEDYRLIALIGVDGSGKTTLKDALCDIADRRSIAHRHVWSRFRNYLSKPLLGLLRLTGHNRKARANGVTVGYHDFQGNRAIALAFLALQWLDNAADIIARYWRCGDLVIADRCIYDTLVDLAVDTGMEEFVFGRYGRSLVGLLPRPHKAVLVRRDLHLIHAQRPDTVVDRHFVRRIELYRLLALRFDLPLLDNDGPATAVVRTLVELAENGARPTRLKVVEARGTMRIAS